MEDFVVTGSRPPSVAGLRPAIASCKDFGYYTKSRQSSVEESLFHSHHASPLDDPVPFPAPWNNSSRKPGKGAASASASATASDVLKKKKPKPGRPLLWTPDTSGTRFSVTSKNGASSIAGDAADNDSSSSSRSSSEAFSSFGTIQGVPLKHRYRSLKHTPTFVDESLFGQPLQEPGFKAPWEERRRRKPDHGWRGHAHQSDMEPVRRRRPATALGLTGYCTSTSAVPVWKP